MVEYQEFANNEYEKMSKAQDEFLSKFDVNSFSKWFYNQESELLRLYDEGGDEMYFKYIPVGSYSLKSNTWMWSWNNEGSIENNKTATLKVKELGVKNDFRYLTKGLFKCDKENCWDFTAISKSLLGGLGVYCMSSNDILKYVILSYEYIDFNSPEVRKLKQRKVECGKHGYRRAAFVCQHLNLVEPKGFEEAFESVKGMDLDDDNDFAAWCKECEGYRIKHDGWDEESEKFANIKLVCEECYFELKEFNK